eukprot:6200051-Pleurochrysis_carterae.AAC.1
MPSYMRVLLRVCARERSCVLAALCACSSSSCARASACVLASSSCMCVGAHASVVAWRRAHVPACAYARACAHACVSACVHAKGGACVRACERAHLGDCASQLPNVERRPHEH